MREKLTHCKHGHEFTEENTRFRNNGSRECIACRQQRDRKRRERANQEQSALCISCRQRPTEGLYKRCNECRVKLDRESPFALDESKWEYDYTRHCMVYTG